MLEAAVTRPCAFLALFLLFASFLGYALPPFVVFPPFYPLEPAYAVVRTLSL